MVGRNRNRRRSRSGPPSDPPPLQHTSSPFFYSNRRCSFPIMIISGVHVDTFEIVAIKIVSV
ncbi:hypothetical protein HanIR_Chr14g0689501 [Helianthus annuus]|nr:hypothetical protein HanIR_Chr14g0689501 [Helianthus annuus]